MTSLQLKQSIHAAFVTLICVVSWAPAMAASIEQRDAEIFSDGVRLHARIYHPESATEPLPTIVMSHGWGGTAAGLAQTAANFAAAGYFVIAFDYRGWGESDSRVILIAPAPAQKTENGFTAKVREVREVIDPIEQAADIFNVIHWAMGESSVDKTRVRLWGTSFSGGLVVHVAAREPRIRALVSQVGYLGQSIVDSPSAWVDERRSAATRRARGETGYPRPGARVVGKLKGAPIGEKFLLYAPIEDVERIKDCAMLFIAAGHEELFDNREHAQLAHERATEPKKYVVIPNITHYDIYAEARDQATALAIDWFDKHLKK